VKLWDVASGREIRSFLGHSSGVTSVAFSPDGKQILSGSAFYEGDRWMGEIKLWDVASGREIRSFLGHSSWVESVAFSPDGKQILSASLDDTVRLWDVASGREIRSFLGHDGSVSSVAFSPDGKQILSGSENFWVRDGDNTVRLWDVASGREIRSFMGHAESVWSVAFSPDGKQILSGSYDKTVRLWDVASGREIRSFEGHSSYVNSVAFSPNGKQILSGSGDTTTRIWDTSTGEELAQLVSFDDGEWVCITPDGFYNASPKGDQHLNVRAGSNVYGIDQYRASLYKPAIVAAQLAGNGDGWLADSQTVIQNVASIVPPVVIIRNPESGSAVNRGEVELSVSVVDQNQPIKSVKVLVNGRLVGSDELSRLSGSRGLVVEAAGLAVSGTEHRVDFRFFISLESGTNHIEVLAANPYSEGRESAEVRYHTTAQQNLLPNLWILSIGINHYDDPAIPDLDYAANDAREIIDAFKAQEGKLYRQVNSRLLADSSPIPPTRDNILDNLDYLRQAGQRDVVMLFIAGHGINDEGGNFLFLPSNAGFAADGAVRRSGAISHRDIYSVLDVPGKKLVFIDSCHSEGVSGKKTRAVDNNTLVRELMDSNAVIFTSSRGSELSQESRDYSHGVFTYAIIQGMQGAADLVKDGVVSMKELDAYVSAEVPRLTRGAQHPTTNTPDGYVDFSVAAVK
jgi:sugar lactone lactonase YvrE